MFLKHIEGKPVIADPNHAVFFNRDETYTISSPGPEGDQLIEFEVHPTVLANFVQHASPKVGDPLQTPFQDVSQIVATDLFWLVERMYHIIMTTCVSDPLPVEETAVLLVGHLVRAEPRDDCHASRRRRGTRRAHQQLADGLQLLLAKRYRESLSLDVLAKILCTSEFHLCRVFKTYTGLTIHAYRNRLRLRAALERLHDIDSISALAELLGFSSVCHFSSAFRAEFGVPPSIARNTCTTTQLGEMSRNLKRATG